MRRQSHSPRHFRQAVLAVLLLLLPFSLRLAAARDDIPGPFAALSGRLAADGFDAAAMSALFSRVEVRFDPSILAQKVDLMLVKEFEPPKAPGAKTLAQSSYGQFLRPWILAWAYSFMEENRRTLAKGEAAYRVPGEVQTAILLVETRLGSYTGSRPAVASLASMAASGSIGTIQPYLKMLRGQPDRLAFAEGAAREKAQWAYDELKALLVYAKAGGVDPAGIPGSVFGAIGFCQFMPSNIARYAADGKGDGRIDLFDVRDALYSVASYLSGHGWREGMSPEEQRQVIYSYNHSDLYALAVMTIAERLRELRAKHGRF
ncbi:MAG: lytic murein transglycosylase [Desulfovibrionaceae bacterium]|nr:lytic murein transglycosylase [Desulfovibrionaceae bacterium]MBF0514314.1 lytic murein transglycosylase [Desulfovibrionaceae bacterium]